MWTLRQFSFPTARRRWTIYGRRAAFDVTRPTGGPTLILRFDGKDELQALRPRFRTVPVMGLNIFQVSFRFRGA